MGAKPGHDPVHLMQRIASGDSDAFERFYDSYAPIVYAFAVRLLRVRSEAEDLLQEVFFQVWRQARSYSRDRGNPEAWLLNMTRSRAIDRLRSIRRKGRDLLPAHDPSRAEGAGKMNSGIAEFEARLTVRGALAKLPDPQRIVLEMVYFDGLTHSEIAARLGEPLGTVKGRIRAALQRLRELVGAKTPEGL